jgi:hypothetical protein
MQAVGKSGYCAIRIAKMIEEERFEDIRVLQPDLEQATLS